MSDNKKCKVEYISKIISNIEDYLYFADNPNLADLENEVRKIPGLNQEFSLDLYYNSSKDFKNSFKTLVKSFNIRLEEFIKNAKSDNSVAKSNTSSNFSSYKISDLFHTLPLAKANFEGYVNKAILESILIGDGKSEKYVSTNTEISDNFAALKNRLFIDIQNFLIGEGMLNDKVINLYNKNGDVLNYDQYKKVIQLLDDYFFNSGKFTLISTYSNKNGIPNLTLNTVGDSDIFKAYNAGILLSNFDSVLQEYYSGIIDINYKLFNNLRSNFDKETKYTLKIEGIKTEYWSQDTFEAEGAENAEAKLTKLLVSIIPIYNKKGINSGMFMEMKDFYLLAAQISDFELFYGNELKNSKVSNFKYFNEDPNAALMWYIDEIYKSTTEDVTALKSVKEHFQYNYEIANSIRNFLNSPDLNILTKEKNSSTSIISVFSQIINNSFGASYITYDASGKYQVREMYKQNFNSTQVQDTVFKNIARNSKEALYNLDQNKKEIDKLLSDLPKDMNIKNISRERKILINNFLKDRLGIYLSYLGFDDMADQIATFNLGKSDVELFKNLLNGLVIALKDDNLLIKEKIKDGTIKDSSKGDSSTSEYVNNTINNSLFKAIQNAYLVNYVVKSVMNIETLTGEKLPTFKLATLTQKDPELFELQREFESNNKTTFRSMLIGNNPVILGTGTKLEGINGDSNIQAVKFNVGENFTADFQFDFLQSLIKTGKSSLDKRSKFSIIIGNYSDKNTVLTKTINADYIHGDGKVPVIQLSMDKLLDLVRIQAGTFYKDAIKKVIDDYLILLDLKGSAGIKDNIKKINKALENTNIRSLSKKASDLGINLTEELHYSKYGNKITLNQLLVDFYNIFDSENLFKEFVKIQEENFLEKFNQFSSTKDLAILDKIKIKEVLEKLNLTEEDFNLTADGKKRDFNSLAGKNGLNPLLRKWIWLNALYRNEYLFISAKGEYMHPHKIKGFKGRTDLEPYSKEYWENFKQEMSGRLSSMAKRNVLFTATIEVPVRKSKLGVPENINMATIDDYRDVLYTISGETKNQEVHDGSSYINYVYSLMIDNSLPSKGFSGTKKQFATFITPNGVVVKKDAESVITNDKILNSKNSLISFYNKQKQMLGIDIGKLDFSFDQVFNNEFFFNKGGEQYRINRLIITDNKYKMAVSKLVNGQWKLDLKLWEGEFRSLFDLWNLFGAEYSTNESGAFNEGSNDLLYRIVTTPDKNGNYILKDKMIHVISNISAVKAGGTNVNSSDHWTNDKSLAYYTFANRFMGPQLDASHDADNSKIKEVTQVISALAQNPQTSHLAQEAYVDIANLIKKASLPYLKYMKIGEDVDRENLYLYLSEKFVRTIEKTKGDTIAKILVQSFSKDTKIPFSNQNFFVPFVRDIITRMNNEFITRYYSGTGAVLIPSHGIIKLYDIPNPDGSFRVATQKDLIREALQNFKNTEQLSNDQIINNYLNSILPPLPTTWDKIQLGDTVLVKVKFKDKLTHADGVTTVEIEEEREIPVTLSTPDLYYEYKANKTIEPVQRILTVARDLRPTQISFKINGVSKNLFDLDSIRLRYKLKSFVKMVNDGTPIIDTDFIILNNFYKFIFKRDFVTDLQSNKKETISNTELFLNKWTRRNLEILDYDKVMPEATVIDNFAQIFGTDNLLNTFTDVKNYYLNNSVDITDYKFDAAELILGDIYKSNFNREESLYEIEKQGSEYFRKNLESAYEPDNTQADIKLNVSNLDKPIYIKYADKLPGNNFKVNISVERSLDEEGAKPKYVRRNEKGEVVYTLPNHGDFRVTLEDGKEIIYIKAIASTTSNGIKTQNRVKNFNKNLSKLIRSFEGNISSLIPLMNNDLAESDDPEVSFNLDTFNEFKKFSGYNPTYNTALTPTWLEENKEDLKDQLSKKIFASWKKSHEFIAARIPSQSMQSFMPMKNVAYMAGTGNDAYVSVWQIFLQGSDFDIDKAYILGSGFNPNGQFDTWSEVTNYSSLEQLNELEKLPIPTGIKTELAPDGLDLTEDVKEFFLIDFKLSPSKLLENLDNIINFNELNTLQIKKFNEILRKINKFSQNGKIKLNNDIEEQTAFISLLDRHNLSTKYLHSKNSINNSIVSRIKQIISMPSSQILANSPVDIENWQEAARKAIEKKGTPPILLSSYDMFSYYKQQRDAAVGKDDVGIAANGLKVFFALTSYYNDYYNNKFTAARNLSRDPKTFKKSFNFNGKSYDIGTIADIEITSGQQEILKKAIGNFDSLRTDAALALSGFTSAATD